MPNLATAVADLGIQRSDFETQEYTQIGSEVERLNQELIDILLPLKTHLSKEKVKDGPFDLTGDLADGRRIVDVILDFKNLFEANYGNGKEFTIKDLDLTQLESVTKEQLEEILSHLSNLETKYKTQTQDQTQLLFLKVNLSLALFNCLHETQKGLNNHMTGIVRNQRPG